MSITPASPSDPKTSAPSLRPGEQILQSIYPGRCSHTLHLTLRNSNIASLSPWFTQPVHQAGIFLLKNFFLSFFFFFLSLPLLLQRKVQRRHVKVRPQDPELVTRSHVQTARSLKGISPNIYPSRLVK